MDIETWHSHQCLDFLWAERPHGCPVWESSGTLQAASCCQSSFHFHFPGCGEMCSSTSPYVAEAPGACLQQPPGGAPAAQAGAQSPGTTAQETRGWRLETAPVSAARAVTALWLRSRAGWHPFRSGVASQALSCRAHLGTGDCPETGSAAEPPQRVVCFGMLSECWAHTSP